MRSGDRQIGPERQSTITRRVGEELLGPRRLEVKQPAEEGKNKRHHSQIMENIVDRLNQARDIKAGEILQDVGGGKDSDS